MENISISLSESEQDRISEVRVDGVIDTTTAGELEQVIDSLIKRDRYRIVIDLAGVDYISSAGWGIFISHIKDVRANNGDIKLVSMVPNVYEIYELLEFDKVLKVFGTTDLAKEDFHPVASLKGETKKKSLQVTRVSVIDNLSSPSDAWGHTHGVALVEPDEPGSADLETIILRLVKHDPFASISEIKREVNRIAQVAPVRWWQVFSILKRRRLLTKRSRFKFLRGHW